MTINIFTIVLDGAPWIGAQFAELTRLRHDWHWSIVEGACEQWEALQTNTKWPVKDLKSFLPWVGPNASADLLFKD